VDRDRQCREQTVPGSIDWHQGEVVRSEWTVRKNSDSVLMKLLLPTRAPTCAKGRVDFREFILSKD